jgi:hypothetical protein
MGAEGDALLEDFPETTDTQLLDTVRQSVRKEEQLKMALSKPKQIENIGKCTSTAELCLILALL